MPDHDPWDDAPRTFMTPEHCLAHYPGIATRWVHDLYGGCYWCWRAERGGDKCETHS